MLSMLSRSLKPDTTVISQADQVTGSGENDITNLPIPPMVSTTTTEPMLCDCITLSYPDVCA